MFQVDFRALKQSARTNAQRPDFGPLSATANAPSSEANARRDREFSILESQSASPIESDVVVVTVCHVLNPFGPNSLMSSQP